MLKWSSQPLFIYFVNLISEHFWKRDLSKEPGQTSITISNTVYLAILFHGFIRTLITCFRVVSMSHTPKVGCLLCDGI